MWNLITDRRVLLSAAVVGALAAVALWPETELVDVATITRGPLVVTVDEEGRTRVRDRYLVTAPAGGRVERIELEPGDRVNRGDIVARLRAEPPALLDARTQAEAAAAVQSAAAVLGRARADEQRARAALDQAERELTRTQTLTAAGATTRQALDARRADARLARETVEAAVYAAQAAAADLERARARVTMPSPRVAPGIIVVRAPASGVVLRRLRESEAVVPPGEPLLEIGDPRQIEIVTDLLSTDAVRVTAGARALVDDWGGDTTLAATVSRIEPSGFTKVSALGVEEQRVNVVLDLADSSACALLGDAYRVEARIVLWEAPDVLRVPTNALFRQGADWAVYTVSNGRARTVTIKTGQQNGEYAEVTAGLSPGAIVVVHPGDRVRDGSRVRERPRS